jgi:phosphoribosylformylglycinamidine cyclo-ligase
MVVDDLAATGARPLGLVDYMAVGALDSERDAAIVDSIAAACKAAGCPLLGGETAEHPGVMAADQVDLAATALGVIERGRELGPHRVEAGDVIIGLRSPNLRSNGFSLVRTVLAANPDPGLIHQALEPSVIYSPSVMKATELGLVHAAAHVTGGGLQANLARVIPHGLIAKIDHSTWEMPEIFRAIAASGDVAEEEMSRTFNLGIGFCLVASPTLVGEVVELVGHDARPIGWVVAG